MRPRLDKEDLLLVLEALACLFQYYARKRDRTKAIESYLLFRNLAERGTGRRREWTLHDEELIPKRRIYYREMQETISDLKSSVSE